MKDYIKRNYIVTSVFYGYLAVIVTAFLYFLIEDSAKRIDSYLCNTKQHTVSYGDTLWEIAQSNCSGNIESAVNDLVKTYGSTIQHGQVIDLPVNNK
jgi:hypothetical protein